MIDRLKIKIFESDNSEKLEREMEDFLNARAEKIINVDFNVSPSRHFSAMVSYFEK
jgi:hypothetical protein